MIELWYEVVENPAYRHVLLNHLPITGLAVSASVLAWALFENRWRSIVFALALCALTSASALLVIASGDAAYPMLFDKLDGPGQAWLDDHAELASRWGRLIPLNAGVATVALVIGWRRHRWRRACGAVVLLFTGLSLAAASLIATAGGHVRHPEFRAAAGGAPKAGEETSTPISMRRLTEAQYRNVVADAFGPGLEVAGRFEPENRRAGLIAVGSARATITASGFERYEAMADDLARQALSPELRERWLTCRPENERGADDACAAAMIATVGPKLLRRPLSDADVRPRVALAAEGARRFEDFWVGAQAALASLLVAPDFLFRIEPAALGLDAKPGRISDESLASRLSFFLWNAGPDDELLAVVAQESLSRSEIYAAQVDRMIASPRFEQGVRALFSDIFQFDEFATLAKDPVRYPIFSARVADEAREQTLRTLVDHLVRRGEGYPTLFTTRESFLTRTLGPVYALPVSAENGWERVTFPLASGRSGLLTHASFAMLHAHAGRSSPTLRGLFLREALLCQPVPPAPADVDFDLFNADDSPEYQTARERLAVHSSAAGCRHCHTLTDPVGLALEPFDGMGRHRTTENGAPIDASGELDGAPFDDVWGLGEAVASHERLVPCLARHAYQSALGREVRPSERRWLRELAERFADAGYKLPALMREIVHSPGFRDARPPSAYGTLASKAAVPRVGEETL